MTAEDYIKTGHADAPSTKTTRVKTLAGREKRCSV